MAQERELFSEFETERLRLFMSSAQKNLHGVGKFRECVSSDFSGSSRMYAREKNEWILFFITFIILTGEVLGAIISAGTGLSLTSLTAKRWDGFHLWGALTPFARENISQYDIFFFSNFEGNMVDTCSGPGKRSVLVP